MAESVTVGVVAAPGAPRELAHRLADDLPGRLGQSHNGVEWRSEVVDSDMAQLSMDSRHLERAIREQMLERDWDLGVGLTGLPLWAEHRPVVAHASATHRVALVSVPALGAVRLEERLKRAVVYLVEGLVGETVGHGDGARSASRDGRITRRLRELSSPLGHARARDDGTIRFVGAMLRGNLRLLVGMVRANQPSRLIARLSAALVASLGTAAFALATPNMWALAWKMTWPRLLVLGALSVATIWTVLVVVHKLWQRARNPASRERVVLANLATALTVALGVGTLYLALFALDLVGAAGLIPPSAMRQVVRSDVGVLDYVRLAWLVTTMGTIGGALGSLIESDIEVQDAAQRRRRDRRIEDPALDDDGY